MITQDVKEGGTPVPPFFVYDLVRLKTGSAIGNVIRVSEVSHAPYLVRWADKARTTGWYAADELRNAWA